MNKRGNKEKTYLSIQEDMSDEKIRDRLRTNALMSHQISVGEGNKLIQLLERSLNHMETTHKWLQYMNVTLFFVGLIIIVTGLILILMDPKSNWIQSLILGGSGGGLSLVTIFLNAPMKRISSGITNLIQLETAFLGFIRAIGEVDSAFQWRYIETLFGKSGGRLDVNIDDTKCFMIEIISTTMKLIDKYIGSGTVLEDSKQELETMKQQINELEKKLKVGH